jgi:hypothetical protein
VCFREVGDYLPHSKHQDFCPQSFGNLVYAKLSISTSINEKISMKDDHNERQLQWKKTLRMEDNLNEYIINGRQPP